MSCPFLQELVGDADAFAQQPAGIASQVEDQSLQIAERIERFRNFVLGRFVEAVDVHVADARLDQEMHINAVARNLIANQRELHRLLDAFTRDADVNRGALGSLRADRRRRQCSCSRWTCRRRRR